MIEWLSTPTIKDCLYSLLCRLHHDILFNLDVPEQDGSRPISQRYWMRYSKEEFIMITDTTLLINVSAICRKAEWYWKSKGKGEEENVELVRIYNSLFDALINIKGVGRVLDEKKAADLLGLSPEEDVEEALYKRDILVKKN